MNLDLPGRVANTTLPSSRPLLPLFDAIINAIDAIQDTRASKGRIVATVRRDQRQEQIRADAVADMRPIVGFVVEDNGVGFNQENYDSFNTADSTLKRSRGGKGVGRFLWLKAFESVHIESCFKSESHEGLAKRTFRFVLPSGIEDTVLDPSSESSSLKTIVNLHGFKEPWASECPKTLDVMASRILDHCAGFFLRNDCPEILLQDDGGSTPISLNARFKTEYAPAPPVEFDVKNQKFSVRHLHIRDAQAKHRVYLCANTRDVLSQQMSLQDLPRRLVSPNGDSYVLASYVSGEPLDSSVNPERTGFALPERPDALYPRELSLQEIMNAAADNLRVQFAAELEKAAEERRRFLVEYTEKTAPEYRLVVKNYPERLAGISVDAGEDRLEQELHRVKRDIEYETKAQVAELLRGAESTEDYESRLAALLETVNELGKSDLIKYVGHRRIVLDILAKSLERTESGKYALEADVHKIIFPLRGTSDDQIFREQNLWIIDERLAYHRYLASDSPLSADGTQDRPDLLIFNRPLAFKETDASGSVVLIEFKRPMRQGYPDDENPIDQVYGYVEKIRAGKATTKDGRPIIVNESSPFYAWIICDHAPSIGKHAIRAGLLRTPDELGYFGWNPVLKTYVEVITYDKLLSDARRKNRAFFERLQVT